MRTDRNYYAILNLSPSATHQDVRRAFRQLALQLHPDVNKSPDATERFQELNEAYQVLVDPDTRAQYDRYQHVWSQDAAQVAAQRQAAEAAYRHNEELARRHKARKAAEVERRRVQAEEESRRVLAGSRLPIRVVGVGAAIVTVAVVGLFAATQLASTPSQVSPTAMPTSAAPRSTIAARPTVPQAATITGGRPYGHIVFAIPTGKSRNIYSADILTDETGEQISLVDLTQVTDLGDGQTADSPSWSADVAQIYYQFERKVYRVKADGTGNKLVFESPGGVAYTPAISADGRVLAFGHHPDTQAVTDLQLMLFPLDDTGIFPLTLPPGLNRAPDWSPDGKRIAYESGSQGRADVVVINADGTGQQRLTETAGDDRTPAWSPDGRKIAFSSTRLNPNVMPYCYIGCTQLIFVMNADGSGQEPVFTADTHNRDPAWSPDGKWIAYFSYQGGGWNLYAMWADGTHQTRLTDFAPVPDEVKANDFWGIDWK